MPPRISPGEAGPGMQGPEYDAMVTHLAEKIGLATSEERTAESKVDVIRAELDIATSSGDHEGELALRGLLETMQGETPESDQ